MKGVVMDKRYGVWASRRLNAQKLAKMGDGDFDKALDLINRTIRFALADAREGERDNDSEYLRYHAKRHAHQEELLEKRKDRLQAEWGKYGLTMVWYGLYPTITTAKGQGEVIYLAYFD